MKFALIGTGKTGSCVQKLLSRESLPVICNSRHLPTLERLKETDAIIVFTTGAVMTDLIPLLLETKRPVISGATNVKWPDTLHEQLEQMGIPWICSSNFSIGMNILLHLSDSINQSLHFLKKPQITLEEIHHIAKVDKPSGTTIKWVEKFEMPIEVQSIREGDEMGVHRVRIQTAEECLTFEHRVLDRTVYARGALWAAEELIWQPHLKGLISFENLVEDLLLDRITHNQKEKSHE